MKDFDILTNPNTYLQKVAEINSAKSQLLDIINIINDENTSAKQLENCFKNNNGMFVNKFILKKQNCPLHIKYKILAQNNIHIISIILLNKSSYKDIFSAATLLKMILDISYDYFPK